MRTLAATVLCLALAACSSDKDAPGPGDEDGDGDGTGPDAGTIEEGPATVIVTGSIVDFDTGAGIAIDPGITTTGLAPEPSVAIDGADFTLSEVTVNSTFHLIGTAPDHITTVAATVTVAEEDVEGVIAYVVSEAFVAALAAEFEVDPGTAGIILARAVDESGEPRAGIPAEAFEVAQDEPVVGPFFLDDAFQPDANLDETSASGWVVFFQVSAGLAAVTAKADSGYLMDMPDTPVEESAATVAFVTVTDGEVQPLPTNVSFADDVRLVFETRGCADCHSGNGPGKDIANLTLDGGTNKIYSELMDAATNPGTRVDLTTPENSLILRMPSAEDPPDGHPTVVFASPNDPDYLTLLVWIREGALNN
jgi:hypothetical protein